MTLHLITRPHSQSESIKHCLSLASNTDAIAFIEDGTYCLLNQAILEQLKNKSIPYYALESDLSARGISVASNTISYEDLVDLSVQYQTNQTWG